MSSGTNVNTNKSISLNCSAVFSSASVQATFHFATDKLSVEGWVFSITVIQRLDTEEATLLIFLHRLFFKEVLGTQHNRAEDTKTFHISPASSTQSLLVTSHLDLCDQVHLLATY